MRSIVLFSPVGLARTLRRAVVLTSALLAGLASAQTSLPPEVLAALNRAKVPASAVSVYVVDADGADAPRIAWQGDTPVNPASVMKLVTTYAGLDLLGPAYSWATLVYLDGVQRGQVFDGNVVLQGRGDPTLVVERLWLLLQRLRDQGITDINGDIVVDRTAFALPAHDPAQFDGEPFRPYNAGPDALLINYRSITLTFMPDQAAGMARVAVEPALNQLQVPRTVPLTAPNAGCGDWRGALKADLGNPNQIRFDGLFSASCGERAWPIAYADPDSYGARALAGMWREVGGTLRGQVREGKVPEGLLPAYTMGSPPLAEVIRDINKFSNNVMAQQLFLTLSLQQAGTGTFEGSQAVLGRWWASHWPKLAAPIPVNGAGLSREGRVTAHGLAAMLQEAWQSPNMPDLLASLPLSGVDGTMRRSKSSASAHLKTGSLRDVAAAAGYVHAAGGKRYVMVFIANHDNAAAARPAIDALIDWTARVNR